LGIKVHEIKDTMGDYVEGDHEQTSEVQQAPNGMFVKGQYWVTSVFSYVTSINEEFEFQWLLEIF
jgi:hypothetical protein